MEHPHHRFGLLNLSITKYIAKFVLEDVQKELKLVKVVTSRYWRSCWPFNIAFWQIIFFMILLELKKIIIKDDNNNLFQLRRYQII